MESTLLEARLSRGGVLFLCVVSGLLGALVLGFAGRDEFVARASPGWPTAEGTVHDAVLETYEREFYFTAEVVYEAGGVRHTCTSVRGPRTMVVLDDPAAAKALLDRYPEGGRVKVWYDPDAPATSTLAPGEGHPARTMWWVGAALVLVPLLVQRGRIVRFLRRKKSPPSPSGSDLVLPAVLRTARLACAVLLVGVGIALGCGFATSTFVRHESPHWPTVEGRVLDARLDTSGEAPIFDLLVEYEVDGVVHRRQGLHDLSQRERVSLDEGQRLLAEHPVGSTVVVSYRPSKPSTSTLRPGEASVPQSVGWMALLLVGLGVNTERRRIVEWIHRKKVLRSVDANVEFRRPRGWRGRMPVSRTHFASLTRGPATLDVHVETFTDSRLPSSATVATARLEIVQKATQDLRLLRRETVEHQGLPAVRMEIEATEGGLACAYATFALGYRGVTIDVIVRTRRRQAPGRGARELLDEAIAGLRLSDLRRSAYSALLPIGGRHEFPRFSIAFAPSSTAWRQWTSRATDVDLVTWGAFHEAGCILTIAPVLLPFDDVPMDAVCRGLLALYGVTSKSDLRRLAGTEGEGEDSRRFALLRTANENAYDLRFHCSKRGRVALLLVLCSEPGNDALDPSFEEALAALEVAPLGAPPTPLDALGDPLRTHGVVWGELAQWYEASNRHVEAQGCYEPLVAALPNDRDLFTGYLLTFTRRGAFAAGLEAYRAGAGRFPDDLNVRAFEPFLLERMSRTEDALAAYAEVVKRGWRDQQDLTGYVSLLLAEKRHDEALALVKAWCAEGYEDRFRTLLARVHRERGDSGAAVALLRAASDAAPSDVRAGLDLVHELVHAGQHDEALEECDRLEDRAPDVAELHYIRGVARSRREWYRSALRAFERAVELDPTNAHYRGWLDSTRTQLGQGDHRLLRRPIEPLALPADEEPPEDHPFADEDAVCLDRMHSIRFRRGSEIVTTRRVRIRIQHPRALERYGTFRIHFDAGRADLFVNDLRVVDAEGRTVTHGRIEDWFVRDDESETAGSGKVAHLPVPGLATGSTLEVTWTLRESGAATFSYRRVDLYGPDPTLRASLDVRGDVDVLHIRASDGVRATPSDGRLRFRAGPMPAPADEPHAVPAYRWLPCVWLVEPRESWEETVRDHLERMEDRFEPVPEVLSLSRRLTDDLTGAEEKAAALVRWVRDELTYRSLPFGPRAWLPDSPADVLASRYGDCKAHSMLLLHLMRGAGLRCELALVHTRDDGLPDAPSGWQFDHMINWCPDLGGGRFVDGVDKGLGPGVAVPAGLAGRMAVVLDATAPEPRRIPAFVGGESGVSIRREVGVEEEGTLRVDEEVRLHGHAASWMRNWLRRKDDAERRAALADLISNHLGRIELDRLDLDALQAADAPVTLSLSYRVPDAWARIEGRLAGRLPAAWERDYLGLRSVARRRSPFEIAYPLSVDATTTVRGPVGSRLEHEGPREVGGDTAFLRWSREIDRVSDGYRATFTLLQRPGRHEREEWTAFVAATERAIDAARASLVVRPRPEA